MSGIQMANVWFIGDIHAGHANIAGFRKCVTSEANNREWIGRHWSACVTVRDIVWVLGDAAFTQDGLDWLKTLPGDKRLVLGNHDNLPTEKYLEVFTAVEGLVRYKGYWLSHAPIHPLELRGKKNIHGHVHYATIPDDNYLNCSAENLNEIMGRPLVNLAEARTIFANRELSPTVYGV